MKAKPRRLAVIPARSGSKGLPGKNFKVIGRKTLLDHTLGHATEAGIFDRITVVLDRGAPNDVVSRLQSCDDEVSIEIRPDALASDTVHASQVVVHTLKALQSGDSFDEVFMLLPTSPLRRPEDLRKAAQLLGDSSIPSVIGVISVPHRPNQLRYVDGAGRLLPVFEHLNAHSQRQDSASLYAVSGAIFAAKTDNFLSCESFHMPSSMALIHSSLAGLDVDCRADLEDAERLLAGD